MYYSARLICFLDENIAVFLSRTGHHGWAVHGDC